MQERAHRVMVPYCIHNALYLIPATNIPPPKKVLLALAFVAPSKTPVKYGLIIFL